MTNRLKPTGGVICAISTTRMTKMPNHSRSIPAACTAGRITAVVSRMIEMPSRKQPRAMKNNVSASSNRYGDSCLAMIQSASAAGRPVKLMAEVR